MTDPDSGIVRHRGMLMQGCNVQAVVSSDQIVVAVAAGSSAADQDQLLPAVDQAREHLHRLGVNEPIKTVLADSGYWNIGQVQALQNDGLQVLVPPVKGNARSPQRFSTATRSMIDQLSGPNGAVYARRQVIVEPVFAQIKHNRKITRLLRRGKDKVQAEIDLTFTAHNLLKLYHSAPAL